MLTPPVQQEMDPFSSLRGCVVRQSTQKADIAFQLLGVPMELEDRFVVSALPEGVQVAKNRGDHAAWRPTGDELKALPPLLLAQERSSTKDRALLACGGCLNLRAFKMPFWLADGQRPQTVNPVDDASAPGLGLLAEQEVLMLDRPFKWGSCCCCDPLETNVLADGQYLGQVREDFRCADCCLLCTTYAAVLRGQDRQHAYTVRTSMCCFGRNNNCCGGTCCNPHGIIDVLTPDGTLVATIDKAYGATESCLGGACTRCCFNFNNYIVEFPPNATPADKKLLLGAVMHTNYQLFATTGQE